MQINFIFGIADKMNAVCQIINGYYLDHRKVAIYSNEHDVLRKLDIMLWSFKDVSFIPHSFCQKKNDCNEEFMVASNNISQINDIENNDILINMSNIIPSCYNKYEGILEIVSENEQERFEARSRWRIYKKDGHVLTGCHFNDLNFPR